METQSLQQPAIGLKTTTIFLSNLLCTPPRMPSSFVLSPAVTPAALPVCYDHGLQLP